MVDVNPSDMLRLSFNVELTQRHGWAYALSRDLPWYEHIHSVDTGLDLLPYGHVAGTDEGRAASYGSDSFWLDALSSLTSDYAWIVFDLPPSRNQFIKLQRRAELDIRVASVDAGCHILLAQNKMSAHSYLLASQYDPSRALSNDILLDWQMRFSEQLIPSPVHRDEAIHEALAHKTTVQRLYPNSVASHDAQALAAWCKTAPNRPA